MKIHCIHLMHVISLDFVKNAKHKKYNGSIEETKRDLVINLSLIDLIF